MTAAPEQFWLPPPASTSALPAIRASLSTFASPPLRVSRVGQLDAALLDHELEGILGGPVWKALEGVRVPGRRSWEPEMMALMRLAVLKMSLFERGATYGSVLQNLKYRNERKHQDGFQSTAVDTALTTPQKVAYITLCILPSYLHSRLRDRMLSSSWADEALPRSWLSLIDLRRVSRRRRRATGEEEGQWIREWKRVVWELLGAGERFAAVFGLANFLVFLYDGRYRTLIDRLLGMRLIYAQRSVNRNVSFEFLNRQLVWEAFTEFLLFLMPLVNLHRVRLRVARFLTSSNSKAVSAILNALPGPVTRALRLPTRQITPDAPKIPSLQDGPATRPQGPLHFLPPTTCPICYSLSSPEPGGLVPHTFGSEAPSTAETSVRVPYVTDCGWGCRYCYYCVVGKLATCEEEAEDHWSCLRCGGEVRGVEREKVEAAEMQVADEEDTGADADGAGSGTGSAEDIGQASPKTRP